MRGFKLQVLLLVDESRWNASQFENISTADSVFPAHFVADYVPKKGRRRVPQARGAEVTGARRQTSSCGPQGSRAHTAKAASAVRVTSSGGGSTKVATGGLGAAGLKSPPKSSAAAGQERADATAATLSALALESPLQQVSMLVNRRLLFSLKTDFHRDISRVVRTLSQILETLVHRVNRFTKRKSSSSRLS